VAFHIHGENAAREGKNFGWVETSTRKYAEIIVA